MNCSRCEGKDANCNVCRDLPEETEEQKVAAYNRMMAKGITIADISRIYGPSKSLVRRWVIDGILTPKLKIGKFQRFDRAEVKKALAEETAKELKRQSTRRF